MKTLVQENLANIAMIDMLGMKIDQADLLNICLMKLVSLFY